MAKQDIVSKLAARLPKELTSKHARGVIAAKEEENKKANRSLIRLGQMPYV
jgi:hypothetical protein